MRTMRLLNILHVFRAPLGGLFRHVVDLARGQVERGHRVGLVVDNLTDNVRAKEVFTGLAPLLALGLTLTPMPRPLSPFDLPATIHVGKRARQTAANVLHGHGAKGGAYARLAFVGRPLVRAYTPHGGSLLLDHATLSGKAYLALERRLMPRGNLYLFESAYSADVFRAKIGQPQGLVRVVHNGVSRAEFAPVTPVPDATDLLFVGEFRPVKGIDTLLDALAILHRSGLPLTATLVGGGPAAVALQAQAARLSLAAAVRFAPAMPMRQALRRGRLMVLPSRAESLPYVVLETAAAGLPQIATHVGGIPEIFGPLSPTLLPPGDAPKLAAAIRQAVADSAATQALMQQLRQQVATSFSLDAMVDGVLAGYEQALERATLSGRPALARA
jgi:glycosyltransferase involved in cell wall biosynthesis